jgi:hypothetical protein
LLKGQVVSHRPTLLYHIRYLFVKGLGDFCPLTRSIISHPILFCQGEWGEWLKKIVPAAWFEAVLAGMGSRAYRQHP